MLQKIKNETKLQISISGKKLRVYIPYSEKRGNVVFDFTKNIENSNLKYLKSEERKVKVKVISTLKDGKKKEVSVGDGEGDEITINKYNISDEKL